MSIQIQHRRDTAANWTAANTILAQGELAYETDTLLWKLGNGVTAWNSLPYWIPPIPKYTAHPAPPAVGCILYEMDDGVTQGTYFLYSSGRMVDLGTIFL